jgi:hypothetical protein
VYAVSATLVILGLAVWGLGMLQAIRLRRRYREKTGGDLYPLVEVTNRYGERPWLWFVEARGVLARLMRVGTTPHSDPELEHMRQLERRLYGIGLTTLFVGVALFFLDGLLAR